MSAGIASRPNSSPTLQRIVIAAIVLAWATLVVPSAQAAGIGANFTSGSSEGRVDDTDDFFRDIDTTADLFEFGVSFDTNLAMDRLVNYRVNANIQIVEQKLNQGAAKAQIDGAGFSLNQLIGFGIVRTPKMRVFIGPTIHLGVAGFDDHDTVQGVRLEYEEVLFTAGIGPEIGANFHLGRNLTVSLTGYYRYGYQAAGFDSPFETSSSDDRVFDGYEHRVGATAAVYFRFSGDQYRKRTRKRRPAPAKRSSGI